MAAQSIWGGTNWTEQDYGPGYKQWLNSLIEQSRSMGSLWGHGQSYAEANVNPQNFGSPQARNVMNWFDRTVKDATDNAADKSKPMELPPWAIHTPVIGQGIDLKTYQDEQARREKDPNYRYGTYAQQQKSVSSPLLNKLAGNAGGFQSQQQNAGAGQQQNSPLLQKLGGFQAF